jgi:hypothetical protein
MLLAVSRFHLSYFSFRGLLLPVIGLGIQELAVVQLDCVEL